MAKIVCRTDYILSLSNIDRVRVYNKKDIKYVNRIIDYFSDDKKRILHMVDYFTGKIKKHNNYNLVLEDGHYATKEELEKRKQYIDKQFNKSNVWQVVLSFDKKFIDENISWRELENKLAKEILPKFFKKMGFENSKNMLYQFSLHTNTKNPHFHISFMEKKPNTMSYNNVLNYRRKGKIDNEDIKWLKNETLLTIEREKYFTPMVTQINKDIEEIKDYFNSSSKNYVLYDKSNILLEDKLYRLGQLLEEKVISNNRKIKFNSIKNEEIRILTKEIKETIFTTNKNIYLSQRNFNDSINRMNYYLINVSKANNIKIKNTDLSYTINKEKYIDNYVLNSIVNFARYNYKNKKIISSNNVLHSIVLQNYLNNKKLSKKDIIRNSLNNNYKLTNEVRQSIKNINNEMDEAAKEFSKLFNNKEKELL